ncbi:tetratricopeptide repeat protein [Leptospira sp. GIMC2001]|uniref:tetratricopeptide repeat protein n=1 Tax=Leptospira sp. GIMC2001 TaxID=1513297 RepID=UPI0023497EEF|nr:tetratricopeptide repeat protein [Leptospira sp. GIMC2001]WCL48214.1 tetratricopeptide repeat protein [Leptospira sp. GIMC2001]
METFRKNRLRFEIQDDNEIHNLQSKEEDYYSEVPTKRRGSARLLGFFFWAFICLIIAGAISFGVWWQFYREKSMDVSDLAEGELLRDKRSLDQILEKPYLPSSHVSAELNKCIQLFRENYTQRAFLACEEFLNTPSSDEEKSIAMTVLGVLFDNAGRYPLAVERLEKATRYDPKNFHAYYNLSLAFRHMGRMEEARKAAKIARDIAPNDPKVAMLSGNLFSELGDTDAALKAYESGISPAIADAGLLYNLALAQYKKGKIVDAIDNFEKSIQQEPGSRVAVLAHGHLGKIYFDQENWKNAEYHFKEAVRLQKDNASNLFNLGLVLMKLGKKEEAVSMFRQALDGGTNDSEVYIRLAEVLDSLKLPSLAIQSLQKALAIRPNDIDSLFALGDIYYKRGDLIGAEQTFRKIISATPGDSYTETALINLGIILDEMERSGEAIRTFERALELNPKNYNAYYNLGIASLHAGEPTRAINAWKKASVLESGKNFKARERIADYYATSGLNTEAVSAYESIISDNPSAHPIRLKLATVYRKIGQSESSERQLLNVLQNSESGSDIKEAHKILALVYSESKNPELEKKARDEAYRASHMDPKDMESRLVLAKILSNSHSMMEREKAVDELKVIVNSDVSPNITAQAYNLMGVCYYRNEEFKKALQSFDMALGLDPSLTDAYDNKRAARTAYEDSLGGRGGIN